MSSPVGHSVVGVAIGILYFLNPSGRWAPFWREIREKWVWLLAAALLANLPDIDYVPGILAGEFNLYHHGVTHTLGWIALVSLLIWIPGAQKEVEARNLPFCLFFFSVIWHWTGQRPTARPHTGS